MASDPYGHLRSCSGCSAHLLTYASADRDEPVYCPKCEQGLMSAEEQLAEAQPRLALFTERYNREYVLLRREGDSLVLRPLGFPDGGSFTTTVSNVRPRFSYAKLSQAREASRVSRRRH